MSMIARLSCLALLLGAQSALAQEAPARPLFYTPNDVILVLGATPQEVPVYKEAMKDAQLRRTGGVEYWEGHIEGKAVALAETGVGKARASTVTSLLITVLKPRVVLMSGTAGRPNPAMRAGDVIVAAELYEAVGVKITAKEMAYWKIEPMRPPASLLALAQKAIATYKPPSETVAALMTPALMPVPSIPCSISLIKRSVSSCVVRSFNSGKKRRWPVHTTICMPDFRETSSEKRTSRPASEGLRSTTVLMPASRAALSLSTASATEIALLLNVFLEPDAS